MLVLLEILVVFLFNANKVVTAGSGGMIFCKSKKNLSIAKYLSTTAKDRSFDFTHNECGYNFRITNILSDWLFSIMYIKYNSKKKIYNQFLS